jgi:uncharacterized membrane protein YhaH (DUF805 family)
MSTKFHHNSEQPEVQSYCCPECACPLNGGETECPECGCPLSGYAVACPECGTRYDALLPECPTCACPNDALAAAAVPQQAAAAKPQQAAPSQAAPSIQPTPEPIQPQPFAAAQQPTATAQQASASKPKPDYALSVLRTVWRVVTLYNNFTGRARRSEFWTFIVFNCMVGFVLYFTMFGCIGRDYVQVTEAATTGEYWQRLLYTCFVQHLFITVVVAIYILLAVLPLLSVTVRRLHDTDRSGWWVLLAVLPYFLGRAMDFSPYIGLVLLSVMLLLDSVPSGRTAQTAAPA